MQGRIQRTQDKMSLSYTLIHLLPLFSKDLSVNNEPIFQFEYHMSNLKINRDGPGIQNSLLILITT